MSDADAPNNLDSLVGLEGGGGVPLNQPFSGQPSVNQPPAGYSPLVPQHAQQFGMYSQPKNGMGIAALVLGIIGTFPFPVIGFWCALLATIFGAIGRQRVRQGTATNKVMTTWGMWLGIVGMGIQVLLVVAISLT